MMLSLKQLLKSPQHIPPHPNASICRTGLIYSRMPPYVCKPNPIVLKEWPHRDRRLTSHQPHDAQSSQRKARASNAGVNVMLLFITQADNDFRLDLTGSNAGTLLTLMWPSTGIGTSWLQERVPYDLHSRSVGVFLGSRRASFISGTGSHLGTL